MESVLPGADHLSDAAPAVELQADADAGAAESDHRPGSLLFSDLEWFADRFSGACAVYSVLAECLRKHHRFHAQSQHLWRLRPGSMEGDAEVELDPGGAI